MRRSDALKYNRIMDDFLDSAYEKDVCTWFGRKVIFVNGMTPTQAKMDVYLKSLKRNLKDISEHVAVSKDLRPSQVRDVLIRTEAEYYTSLSKAERRLVKLVAKRQLKISAISIDTVKNICTHMISVTNPQYGSLDEYWEKEDWELEAEAREKAKAEEQAKKEIERLKKVEKASSSRKKKDMWKMDELEKACSEPSL